MKKSLQVAATYIGAVMGAGFASGQEIQQFFICYGKKGIWGIGIAGLMFAILGCVSLIFINKHKISSYQGLFSILFGKKVGNLLENTATLFLFAGLVIMLAGCGAISEEFMDIPPTIGILLTAGVAFIALSYQEKGVIWLNALLIPVKLLICIAVGIMIFKLDMSIGGQDIGNPRPWPWFISSILYVSFNMTFALVVLSSLGKEIRGNILGGLVGGVGLGVFALIIGISVLSFSPDAAESEVPMIYVAYRLGTKSGMTYLLVLWFAMLTASVGCAFSFVKQTVEKTSSTYGKASILTMMAAIPLAHLSFSGLVSVIYPVFGIIGLITIVPLVGNVFLRK